MQATSARACQILVRAMFSDGDVDACERELCGEGEPCGTSANDEDRVVLHSIPSFSVGGRLGRGDERVSVLVQVGGWNVTCPMTSSAS
jgi:hypothetical protein